MLQNECWDMVDVIWPMDLNTREGSGKNGGMETCAVWFLAIKEPFSFFYRIVLAAFFLFSQIKLTAKF